MLILFCRQRKERPYSAQGCYCYHLGLWHDAPRVECGRTPSSGFHCGFFLGKNHITPSTSEHRTGRKKSTALIFVASETRTMARVSGEATSRKVDFGWTPRRDRCLNLLDEKHPATRKLSRHNISHIFLLFCMISSASYVELARRSDKSFYSCCVKNSVT